MRRFASGRPWDIALPFEDREQHWGCVNGVTYLTDSIVLVRLAEATVSDTPQAESKLFAKASAREMVDVALQFKPEDWQPLPDTIPLCVNYHRTGYLFVEVSDRLLQLAYFIWLTDTFGWRGGMPEVAGLYASDPAAPVYFRFPRGYAVLMPVVDKEEEG